MEGAPRPAPAGLPRKIGRFPVLLVLYLLDRAFCCDLPGPIPHPTPQPSKVGSSEEGPTLSVPPPLVLRWEPLLTPTLPVHVTPPAPRDTTTALGWQEELPRV